MSISPLLHTPYGIVVLSIFAIAYIFVVAEEWVGLNKSKTVVFAASLIWIIIAFLALGDPQFNLNSVILHYLAEYVDLLLFLLVTMAYIHALHERRLFARLQQQLTQHDFTYHKFYWLTGLMAFFLSPLIDNLTTALILGSMVFSVKNAPAKFYTLTAIHIVVAANAGGVFSPFGDITSLMIWQKNLLLTKDFWHLLLPAFIAYIIPAGILAFNLPQGFIEKTKTTSAAMKTGAIFIGFLFVATIITTILCHHYLHLPTAIGMMMGLSYLKFYAYYLDKHSRHRKHIQTIDVFNTISAVKWEVLLFFYGMMLCVGGLATLGYLSVAMQYLYAAPWTHLSSEHSMLFSNVLVGVLSAIIDNIPIVYAILNMEPSMPLAQWQLVALTAGVGGSLLSIGSAAGVALMGTSKHYSFLTHLRWSWAILLGYFAAIAAHYYLNF